MRRRIKIGSSWPQALHVEAVQEAWKNGNLSLFLGAGLSILYGLPNWSDLVTALLLTEAGSRFKDFQPHYQYAFALWLTDTVGFGPTSLARVVKYNLRRHNQTNRSFHQAIKDALYANYQPRLNQRTSLVAVARLIADSQAQGGRLKRIITFNLDDLLEQRLQERNVECRSLVRPATNKVGCIDIVHPHGVIPQHDAIPQQEIVFSEDEYHQITIHPFHWALTQLTWTLSSSTVLCVGLSMTDPNLKRLIDACKSPDYHHYIVKQDYDISRIDPRTAVEAVQHMAKRERKRRGLLFHKESDHEVENAIQQILKQAHIYDRQLFKDMGCRIIWLKAYEDIPLLLDYISGRA
jgi:SIR2-like domain